MPSRAPSAGALQAASRLSSISSHLSTASAPASAAPKRAMAAQRPPITCHILDTTTGSPAPDVAVTLTLINIPSSRPGTGLNSALLSHVSESSDANISFTALTNDDGRVAAWAPATSSQNNASPLAGKPLDQVMSPTGEMAWKIEFEIGAYYAKKNIRPFFPKVDIHFVTGGEGQEGREHYHVPLLVGPYNYTTYRGS